MSSDNNTTSIPISGVDAARQLGLGGSGGGSGGSGVGKNKARKTKRSAEEEATKKAQLEQKLLRQKAFDNAKMPEFTPYQQKTVPYGWKRPDHGWLVCERVNCIPPDYLARMVAW